MSCYYHAIKYIKKKIEIVQNNSNCVHRYINRLCSTPTQQFFSYIMVRTSWFSMRWWWWGPLCTRPRHL